MRYKVFSVGREIGSFQGEPNSDSRGNYVIAPLEFVDIAIPGTILESESGDHFMIQYQTTEIINGSRKLLLYSQ